MEFKKVTKTLRLGDYHPDLEGVEIELWVNPPRRILRELFSLEREKTNGAFCELLGISEEELDDMPNAVAAALISPQDRRGIIWQELDAYRDELVKNLGGGSDSSKTE